MEIIVLILVLAFAYLIVRAVFNVEWNNDIKTKMESLRKERIFLRLVRGFEGFEFNVEKIFTIYLDSRHLETHLGIDSVQKRTEIDKKVLDLIVKTKGFSSLNALKVAAENADKVVTEQLELKQVLLSKVELLHAFESSKNNKIIIADRYDDLFSKYVGLLPDSTHFKNTDLWEARKRLKNIVSELEWETDERKVDSDILFNFKKSEIAIGKVVHSIILDTKSSNTLRDSFTEWENLQMMLWCITDHNLCWIETTVIQRFGWKVLAEIIG